MFRVKVHLVSSSWLSKLFDIFIWANHKNNFFFLEVLHQMWMYRNSHEQLNQKVKLLRDFLTSGVTYPIIVIIA